MKAETISKLNLLPDDIRFHLERPHSFPIRGNVTLRGWIVSPEPLKSISIGTDEKLELNLVKRPDVKKAYPAFSCSTGFEAVLTPKVVDDSVLTFRIESERREFTYQMPLHIERAEESILEKKCARLKKVSQLLRCPKCSQCLVPPPLTQETCQSLQCNTCNEPYFYSAKNFDFLTEELKQQVKFQEAENESAHFYDSTSLSIIAKFRDGLILDCGSGTRINQYPNVINFDINDEACTDVRGANERLPFVDESFDAVFSLAVLEHVKDPFRCAKEISRVLKKGGILYCVVPLLAPVHAFPNHFYNMTAQGLGNLFADDLTALDTDVPESGLPISILTWFLQSWAGGLPPKSKAQFLKMRVSDLIKDPRNYTQLPFVRELSQEKNFELAGTTLLIAEK